MTPSMRRLHRARSLRAFLPLAFVLAIGGCEKSDSKGGTGGNGVPSSLLDGWSKASLTVSAFTADKSGAVGASCQSGTVSGVDVVVCAFPSDAEAKAAQAKGLEWVGAATGTSLVSGKFVLAVADRRAADPTGRTINAITKAFR